ncbi:MAG: hypothetical protein AAGG75_25165 [Bacteroidota bacterium]
MHNSKLFRLLQGLDREDFRHLGQFVHSPFFNTNEKLIAFYAYIAPHYPGLFSPKLAKERAFAVLFPKKAYDDSRMRQLMFKMTQLVEEFLAVQLVRQDEGRQQQLLIEALGRRQLHSDFQKKTAAEIKRLEGLPFKDLNALQLLLRYNHDYFFHPDTPKFRIGVKSIKDCMRYLDAFFVQAKLQYASELVTRSAALQEEHDIWLLPELMNRLLSHPPEPLSQLYHMLMQLHLDRENEALFAQLKAEFSNQVAHIPEQERMDLYQQLSNYTISKINAGKRSFQLDFFELTEIAVNYNMLIEKERITDATFTNIVAIAAALKKFDWTAQFINNYYKKLARNVRDSATQLAQAYYHYHKGEFNEVLNCLKEVEFLPSYGFRVKSLRLRTYFELFQQDESYLDPLLSDIHSFDLYIRRHKSINTRRRSTYLNFIQFTKKLIRLKTNIDTSDADKQKLSDSIQKKEPMVVKHWLLEKLKEL